MAARQRRITSIDVAREAGVSQTTVSYVLNNVPHQKISEETRSRIFAAVDKLGYAPSAAARTLRRGRSDLVLIVLSDVPLGATLAQLVEHLTDDLERHGLTAITRRERRLPVTALARELEPTAIVAFTAISPEDRASLRAAGIKVVSARLDGGGENVLTLPQTEIGRLQAGHLAATGRRRIGYAAPDDPRVRDFYHLRLGGVRQACAELGLEPPDVRDVPLDTATAAEVARGWHGAGVDGVCAYNDETAFALLAGMRAAGLAAPGDLAVIGVDDIPLAPFAVPPLTTVDQHTQTVAEHLTEMILRADGARSPQSPRTETASLVIRESA
ncbi:LacI family DNA-binding transcriptional regulator [Nonomuraea sp. NPDC052129]|uniref:LacI family DNA-binding transcriptional regulator n=1 Tax=Nonomuraea sp. NPDC052129 TaxID=3154651 RepID=UPI0034178F6F